MGETVAGGAGSHKPKLLEQVRDKLRRHHYSLRTEEAYLGWIRRFILFHRKRHPKEMGAAEVEEFLTHLAVEGNVAASTQNQALGALLFLYRKVLEVELPWLQNVERAKKPQRLPVVLTKEEARALLAEMEGTPKLVAELLYGAGLRLLEALRLRVKDVDFRALQIVVRDGKGAKDRITMLPVSLVPALRDQLARAERLHRSDLREGFGTVWLPEALERKFPNAPREWAWQWIFPADRRSSDPRTGMERRHHLHERSVQVAVKMGCQRSGIAKPASPHARSKDKPPGWNS